MSTVEQLEKALSEINLEILKYDETKQRPISTRRGAMSIEKFCTYAMGDLARYALKYPKVWEALLEPSKADKILRDYAEEKGVLKRKTPPLERPEKMAKYVLNLNLTSRGAEDRFFVSNEHERIVKTTGSNYLLLNNLSQPEAARIARLVIPQYDPRGPAGITEVVIDGEKENIFNSYVPPVWVDYPKWDSLPDKLPALFDKLVKHLFPLLSEREYFFAWLYESLFARAFVFLVLCGAPGTGKNRLKLVLRALHGHKNTADGKKSTLVERFNSQIADSTLTWFDELKYDAAMENTMKELQNDSISIERKGVDTTKSTKIHPSLVISNNKPRDNYIAFDARKFAPLVITDKELGHSMTSKEIDTLTKKVENDSEEGNFDVAFIAQIAKWVKNHGKSNKWPNLEYKGPMFWSLAHTSMTRWQKKAVTILLGEEFRNERSGFDGNKKAFLWSKVHERSLKKNGDRSLQFPDYTSVRAFFNTFKDSQGRTAFHTTGISGDIMGDFWVKPLFKSIEVVTEASISLQRKKQNGKTSKKEIYDL
jgi:hypothetical protein